VAAGGGAAGAVSAAGAAAGGASAGVGGEGGEPCAADDCPAWVQVGGELIPAYSYAIAASASEVGTVYTGNDSNGSVYKTTTSGASWFPADNGLDQVGVHALAVDPFDASYVWAGTSSGLYRSANAGGSWSKLNIASDFPQGQWITVDPVVRGRVYVLLNPGNQVNPAWSAAFASDDRGLSWRRLGTPFNFRANTLDVDASDPSHLFLGTYGQGVFESHDGGASFQPLTTPPAAQIFQVSYEPTSKTLCALVANGIARSLDGGATWQTQPVLAYLLTLAPGPTFYVDGNSGVYRSTDCSNWTQVDPHRGYHAVVDSAGAVYAASVDGPNFQGVRRSPDGLSPFVNVNKGITTADVSDLALDATTSDGLFAIVRNAGIFHSGDGAASFSSATGNLAYAGSTAFPDALSATGNTLFAFVRGVAGRLSRSDDQGSTWSTALLSLPSNGYASAISVLPSPTFARDDLVYLGTRTVQGKPVSFEQSLDGGKTFTPRGNGDFATLRMIWDKTHQGWLWALGARTVSNVQSVSLYQSQDTGLSWSQLALPVQGNYSALEAALTPMGEVLYVAVSGQGLLRSDDAGSSWRLAGAPPGDLFASLAVDPTDGQTLYAVTASSGSPTSLGERGLFKSRDGGASWAHADRGLPPAITSLLIQPNNPQIVYAGIRYGGVYKTTTGGQ
jgi:photosystem II stability/assembly factor-like uncharacterized protein